MKKNTTFLALLLTCIIGATAADFVPVSGVKYLIKCKGNKNAVYMPEGTGNIVLQAKTEVTDASYFTIESKIVNEVTYFYIHPNSDATKYVYTEAPSTNNDVNDGVVKIKTVSEGSDPDEACLWKITYNGTTVAFNITPKGYDNYSWNCRSNGIGYWHTGGNNANDNSWYITPKVDLNGYYTIKSVATDRWTNLYNDLSVDDITRAAENLPTPLTNNYVWHVTTTDNNVLTVHNGQGSLLYHDGNASVSTLDVAYSDGTKYFFTQALNCGNSGRNYKLTTWPSGGFDAKDNQWTLAKIEYNNIYTVECNLPDGYVTYNATNEKAKNGGFFNIGTAPTAEQFIANTVKFYDATVALEGNVIKVNYTHSYDEVKNEADAVIAKTGAGYPTAEAAARKTLQQAIAKAEAAEHNASTAATLYIAVNTYKNSKVDIQMPEDGKAYVITNIHKTGGKRYMKYESDGTSMIARGEGELPIEATYICHKVGDKYVFANNSGTYLTWRGKATTDCTNNNLGFTTSYDADYNTFTVATNPNVFGCLSFGAKRNDTRSPQSYYIITRTGAFEKAGFDNFYNDDYSSAFLFEEVTYPNTITFHAATNIEGVSHIATFSAPFATIIPEGVKAYYVSAKDTQASMTAIEASQAIPANEGVILTSETGASVTMVPAADETAATISDNKLGHSAGAAKTLTAGEVYILANGTSGTAFYPCQDGNLAMNKAYLLGNNGGKAITMNFDNTVTAINGITTNAANAQAPIYDLSGRRVMSAAKSGLYIQNGKKFIVK
jgi:hypothetical protein